MSQFLERLADPAHAVVIVVDMQNDYCSEKGSHKSQDYALKKRAAENIVSFLRKARSMKVRVIHVKTIHSEWTDSASWLSRSPQAGSICRPGTWGAEWWEEFPQIWPQEGEHVVVKHRYSAFIGTDLDLVLRSKGIHTVILTGNETNWCIESTARDAFMMGYDVVVVDDCVASRSGELHQSSLAIMKQGFVTVATSGDIFEKWAKLPKQR
jgi:ureidoacrylate peracid hydrolase